MLHTSFIFHVNGQVEALWELSEAANKRAIEPAVFRERDAQHVFPLAENLAQQGASVLFKKHTLASSQFL